MGDRKVGPDERLPFRVRLFQFLVAPAVLWVLVCAFVTGVGVDCDMLEVTDDED